MKSLPNRRLHGGGQWEQREPAVPLRPGAGSCRRRVEHSSLKKRTFSVLSRKLSKNFNFWAYLWRNNRQWQPREEHPIWWKGKSLRPREDWSLLLEGGRRRCWWWLARRPEKLGKNTSNSNQIFTKITQNSYLVFFSVICHCLLLLVGDLVGILVHSKKIKL